LGQTMLSNSGLCPPLNNIILKDPSFLFSVIENFKCMQMQRTPYSVSCHHQPQTRQDLHSLASGVSSTPPFFPRVF
jgi:hypothetical protein